MSLVPDHGRTPAVPDVHRIAVLRATAIGDFVFALPALDALRAAYPAAEITLLGREWHRRLLAGRPSAVDSVIALPEGFVGDEPGAMRRGAHDGLRASLRDEGFDVAIQMHGGGRNSNHVVQALHARLTAGTATPDAPSLDRMIPYEYWQHEIARCLEVVGLVGAAPITVEPRLEVSDRDRAAAALAELGDADVIVLHPGATDPRRRWPLERFAAVADAFVRHGHTVVVTGTAPEAALGRAITRTARERVVDLTGALELTGLVGLLDRARLVVSNDTGPLHLATAVGTPSVGLFWAGNAINAAPPFRERHRALLSWRLECAACGTNCMTGRCPHDSSFIDGIETRDVLDACGDLLASAGGVPEPAARDRSIAVRVPDVDEIRAVRA